MNIITKYAPGDEVVITYHSNKNKCVKLIIDEFFIKARGIFNPDNTIDSIKLAVEYSFRKPPSGYGGWNAESTLYPDVESWKRARADMLMQETMSALKQIEGV
jgi:hypothetical protein